MGRYLAGRLPELHLNEIGREQADRLPARLAKYAVKAVYSSPLERARETAEPIAAANLLPVLESEAPLAGRRVLVRCYHGLGDTLQFIRYLPQLVRIAREVTVWIQPALIPLLSATPGLGRLLPLHDGAPDVSSEVDVEIMELARVFRTTVATIPRQVPYIRVPPAPPAPVDGRVGIAWAAGDWDARRSVPIALLEPLLTLTSLQCIPLHGFRTSEEARRFPGSAGAVPILQLAGLMASSTAIVSVDTIAAHLAGALGVTTHLMLHADADWRWMNDRCDSPWDPTLHLHRQRRQGHWRPVVDAVRARLLEDAVGTEHGASALGAVEDG